MRKSFTLIELLVVIAIIGILSSLVILNITTGREETNNARRIQEVNGLVKALAIYENQYGFSGLTTLSTTLREVCNTNVLDSAGCLALDQDVVDLSGMGDMLPNVPVDPSLPSDNPTTGYWVAKNHAGNEPMVVPGLYQADCPTGYISVPGNSYYNTLPGFCVMKWEAKCAEISGGNCGISTGDLKPVSQAANDPWGPITQNFAKNRCLSVDAHLITNNEWMTIARNVEAQERNWANGIVGSTVLSGGGLFRGNNNQDNSVSCGSNVVLDGLTVGTNCEVGGPGGRNKRMHYLTNNEEVWDMSGNVWNWIDEVASDLNDRPRTNISTWLSAQFSELRVYGKYSYDLINPSGSAWSSGHGVGYYWLDSNVDNGFFIRGGRWDRGNNAGIFSLSLLNSATTTASGFRCAK